MDTLRERLMKDFATRSGVFVSGSEDSQFLGGWQSETRQNIMSSSSDPRKQAAKLRKI